MKCFAAAIAIGCMLPLGLAIAVDTSSDLLPLIDDAIRDVSTVSSDGAAVARNEVIKASRDVRKRLTDEPIGQWLVGEMRLDELERQLTDVQPDIASLRSIERSWHRDTLSHLPVNVADLTTATRGHLAMLQVSRDPDHVACCRRQLTELRDVWIAHRRGVGDFDEVNHHYSWLAERDAASVVRAWLDEHASWPNLWLEASQSFCESLLPESIERHFTIDENNDGTALTGRGTLHGALRLAFEASDDQAIARLGFAGHGQTELVGHRGSAKVDARSTLELRASQQFIFDDNLRLGGPADIDVHVGSEPLSATVKAGAPLMRQIGSRAAMSMATRKREVNDRQAEERLRARIEREFAERLQSLTAAIATFENTMTQQLAPEGLSVDLRGNSTTASLAIGLRLAGDRHLAAPNLATSEPLPKRDSHHRA